MDAYKSINLIVALVWLYFAFMVSVLVTFPINSSTTTRPNSSTENATKKDVLTDQERLGKVLFKTNCASCHNKYMRTDMTGPALKGITERWSAYPSIDLYAWIKNSEKLIAKKHPRAIEISAGWNYDKMTSMEHLQDSDISALIAFIER